MRNFLNTLINILFRLLKMPIPTELIDKSRMNDWIGLQYPLKEFHNYIGSRNLHILQVLGEGVSRDEEYWMYVGQRIELGHLLTEAKKNFAIAEKTRKRKQNEALKKQKS